MCVVACKYFNDVGWVGLKQRDRNYSPTVRFVRKAVNGIEVLLYRDCLTGYREGLNENGVSILSASLRVIEDENEINRINYRSEDGDKIEEALGMGDLDSVLEKCLESGLTGNTLVFDSSRCFLIEACGYKNIRPYQSDVVEFDKSELAVRTNHGIKLTWAGYQTSDGHSRLSSESRLRTSLDAIKGVLTPCQIMDALSVQLYKDPQMNPTRIEKDSSIMHTTAQILITPSDTSMAFRPFDTQIEGGLSDGRKKGPVDKLKVNVLPLTQDHTSQTP